jgi:protein-L-isoaspartate(D-aspartate) O-methyltransferase
MSAAEEAHRDLVDQLIAVGALWSPPLVAAFRQTPRHLFVDRVYLYRKDAAGGGTWRGLRTRPLTPVGVRLVYSDRALVTRLADPGGGQPAVPVSSSSQPSLMARMVEDLRLAPGLRTLEVGAGTGYNAALLARLVGRVVSVEVDRRVLAEARRHLAALSDRPVVLLHGDGRLAIPGEAPFDRIMVTAATPDLEPAWLNHLAPRGLLLAPWELAPGLAFLVRGRVVEGSLFEGRLVRPAYFMPLRKEDETGTGAAPGGVLPPPEALDVVDAPWASWSRHRPMPPGPGYLMSLAFLAWLAGLVVRVHGRPDGEADYGLGDPVRGHACWMGPRQWHISGTDGRELGRRLWHMFLDLGGPWPTDFRLRAWPAGAAAPGGSPDRGLVFRRRGPRCDQAWELVEPRERH